MELEGRVVRDEEVLAFLKGEMSPPERAEFEAALTRSAALRAEVERHRALLDALEASNDRMVSERVREQVRQAIARGASDIHIVPGVREVAVQVRVGGMLHEIDRYNKEEHTAVVDRWKSLADVSLMERQLPQDGRALVQEGERAYDVRVSISPGVSGERVVARVIDRSGVFLSLEQTGLLPEQVETVTRMAGRPNGLIIATGPTGSGKTTLLYSMLQLLVRPERSPLAVLTVEDPVEFLLEGTTQVNVRRQIGLNFATALRSFLRQDPDVIMVGELRDLESAEIAIQAAVTGHLVFTTLHTLDTPSAAGRLVDMGIAPFLVANTLSGIIAMRLVRKPCAACQVEYEPNPDDLQRLGLSSAEGPFFHGTGCEVCHGNGYIGRTGLFEVLDVDADQRRVLGRSSDMGQVAREWLLRAGQTMRDDARRKIKMGLTTVEEAARVL